MRDEPKDAPAIVRFDDEHYFDDLKRTAEALGLDWSETIARSVVDVKEKRHEPVTIQHVAQVLHDRFCGASADIATAENQATLRRDAALREATLRKAMREWRAKATAFENRAAASPQGSLGFDGATNLP